MIAASVLSVMPVLAMSPAPQPEPEISLERALELAKEHAQAKKIDLSRHYLDRIWIGHQEGQQGRRWIVSWSPKPEKAKETQGWIILTVKLDGTVASAEGAVPWIGRRADERVLPPRK